MSDFNENYTDNSFNLYQAYSYTLLLQVETNTFSYAVINQNQLLVSAQNVDIDELIHPKQLSELLIATYKKVLLGLPATNLTLVPKSLFSQHHAGEFARYLDVKESEKVFAQKLDDQNNIIYKTSGAIASLAEKFGFANTVYTAQGWIKAIANTNPPDTNLYIEIGKNALQFLYFSAGSLRFYNAFDFNNEDELVYFTSFVADELKLKPLLTTLVLSGDVTADDKNITRLSAFFPKIELNGIKVLDLPGQIPSHKLLALAALTLCE